ncbi:hypothetical protein VF21_03580 [Pseudogymnoascus sp. 05NY08]|nr:hypothetical protein VF21_03580 [Pseudogymnoascus sp. 05NY08]
MPVELPKLGLRGQGVWGARTGPSLAANQRDAHTAQYALEVMQLTEESNMEHVQAAIDARREATKLPAQAFSSSYQAMHELCRLVRAELDALIKEHEAAREAAKAHETFAQDVLADIKKIGDAVGGDGGAATEREVQAAMKTACNLLHERLDKLDGKGGVMWKGFEDLQKELQSAGGAKDIKGLIEGLQGTADGILAEAKAAKAAEAESVKKLLKEQSKITKAIKGLDTVVQKIATDQAQEAQRTTTADDAAAQAIKEVLKSSVDHASVTGDSAKKLEGIVGACTDTLKKIGDVERAAGDAGKHAGEAAKEAAEGRREGAESARKISTEVKVVSDSVEKLVTEQEKLATALGKIAGATGEKLDDELTRAKATILQQKTDLATAATMREELVAKHGEAIGEMRATARRHEEENIALKERWWCL